MKKEECSKPQYLVIRFDPIKKQFKIVHADCLIRKSIKFIEKFAHKGGSAFIYYGENNIDWIAEDIERWKNGVIDLYNCTQ